MTNQPTKQFKLGLVSLAAWSTEKGVNFGAPRLAYKDPKSGEWQEAKFWKPTDIAALALITKKAAEWALAQSTRTTQATFLFNGETNGRL